MSFVHLHCRTHYSFLDGAMSPAELVEAAVKLGMTAVAMTDAANLCGMIEFHEAAKKAKIKPIYGAEVWIGARGKAKGPPLPDTLFATSTPETEDNELSAYYQLVLLVENQAGYRNLCDLITLAHEQRRYVPVITEEQLIEHHDGLVCLTSAEHGPLGRLPDDELEVCLAQLTNTFNNKLYVELVDWGTDAHTALRAKMLEVAHRFGLPCVATNNCRYRTAEDVVLYETLRSIALGDTTKDPAHEHATDQASLKSEAEMLELWDADAVHASGTIADQLSFTPALINPCLPDSTPPTGTWTEEWAWLLKRFPPPTVFGDSAPPPRPQSGTIVDAYCTWYARTGLDLRLKTDLAADRFGTPKDYWDQLEMELSVIQQTGFTAYHLIVAEFTNWAKDHGIAVGPGRGSAAGSIVVWAMRITDINPRQFGLMFERYLNPKRVSMPDIDMDFEQERREEVINHVREKYGAASVAQILTIGKMKAKAALKDAARTCSVHFLDADKWSKKISDDPKVKLWPSIEDSELLKAMWNANPMFRRITTLALGIEGRPRQTGVHAAGVIITDRPVSHFLPLHREKGISMTGLEMTGAEKMGLVKFDFLGLKNLDVIKETVASIERRTGTRPEVTQPLYDDPAVYELISAGDTLGLFQIESRGMQNLVRRIKPDCIEDLIAVLALYRPGPLGSGMVDQYIECKHGRTHAIYPHKLLEEVLKPTHGVIVYQEQVMKSAQTLAGYDLAGADLLRRAMGKKKKEEMDAQRSSFVEGCGRNNISADDAERIFNLIDHFAGYGFNKSHTAAYAVITYMTAWLKAHYRADFMSAAMSFEAADRDSLVAYVHDARRAGIQVRGPHINLSEQRFRASVENDVSFIRFGLGAIKGIGSAALEAITAARTSGPFRSMADLRERTGTNKAVLEALIMSGALDSIEEDRFEAWWSLNKPPIKTTVNKKTAPEQLTLFGGSKTVGEMNAEAQTEKEQQEKPDRWNYTDRLTHEASALGVWLSGHPLDRYSNAENRAKTVQITSLEHGQRGDTATIVGVITKVHKIKTKHGSEMTFLTLADRTGMTEVVLRPDVWTRHKNLVTRGDCVGVHGILDRDGAEGRVVVDDVFALAERQIDMANQLDLYVDAKDLSDELVSELKKVVDTYAKPGKAKGCKLRIIVDVGEDTFLKICLPSDPTIEPDQSMFDRIERITGRPNALRIPGHDTEPVELDTPRISSYADGDPDEEDQRDQHRQV